MQSTSKIRRQGGAAIMTIPSAFLKHMQLDIGSAVDLSLEDGKLIATPASGIKKRYSLAELLEGSEVICALNAELAWTQDGNGIGKEVT